VFAALDGKQRKMSLLGDPRKEEKTATIAFRPKDKLDGLPASKMSKDQRKLVEQVLADLLLPFRKKDVEEAMRCITNGGINALSMAFCQNLDLGLDKVWDVWQLENPKMVWYFRGHPHVHTWVNIKALRPLDSSASVSLNEPGRSPTACLSVIALHRHPRTSMTRPPTAVRAALGRRGPPMKFHITTVENTKRYRVGSALVRPEVIEQQHFAV
jgi:hypothetical protein